MVTVSLQPLAFRKVCLLVAAIVGLTSAACFADPLFMNVGSTPYDRQMTPIQPVLISSSSPVKPPGEFSIALVDQWMQELRSIPYAFSQDWKTPSEVETGAPADCKGKAVALYQRMQSHGATNMRLGIGKRTPASKVTHAWIEWQNEGANFVLDPTMKWMACRSDSLKDGEYIPLYAFAGALKFRAMGATLYAKN